MELEVAEVRKEEFAEDKYCPRTPALSSSVVWQSQSPVQLVGGRWGLGENSQGVWSDPCWERPAGQRELQDPARQSHGHMPSPVGDTGLRNPFAALAC